MHADPPAWIFPVQACDSNYITLKQIQITDTLVAKFRKAHDATPQHGTFCEKAPCTDLRSDPTLHQNSYRTTQADAYVNHAHQASAARVVTDLIKLKHCRVKKTVSPSTPTC